MLTAKDIVYLLALRYPEPQFAFVREFRTRTGAAGPERQSSIDAVAVGLWEADQHIYAFEIKVDRGDFLRDIKEFHVKQGEALALSTQFYFIAPVKVIGKEEVPEEAGLMEVTEDRRIRITKIAPARNITGHTVSAGVFRSMARKASGAEEAPSPLPRPVLKYLGKEISAEAFLKLVEAGVEEGVHKNLDYRIRKEARAMRDEMIAEVAEHAEAVKNYREFRQDIPDVFFSDGMMHRTVFALKQLLTNRDEIIKNINSVLKALEELDDGINKKKGAQEDTGGPEDKRSGTPDAGQ